MGIAWKVGADDDGDIKDDLGDIKDDHGDIKDVENTENSPEYFDSFQTSSLKTAVEEEESNSLEKEARVSCGSVGSFGSLAGEDVKDDKDSRLFSRRSKKASVCSNMSAISISSEQPYMALMSNLSRDRKLSSLSSESYCDTRHMMSQSDNTQ